MLQLLDQFATRALLPLDQLLEQLMLVQQPCDVVDCSLKPLLGVSTEGMTSRYQNAATTV